MCGRYGYYHSQKDWGDLLVSLGAQHPFSRAACGLRAGFGLFFVRLLVRLGGSG